MVSTFTFGQFNDRYPILAIFTASAIFMAALILIFTERLAKMDSYLNKFQFLKNHPRVIIMLKVFYYISLTIPIILLIIWVVLLILNVGVYPGIPVFLYGLFFIGILVPSSEKLYYLKTIFLFLIFVASQILTLALNPNWNILDYRYTFYGISAVLLGANGVIFCLVLWLVDGREWNLNEGLIFIQEEFLQHCPIWKQNAPLLVNGGAYSYFCNSKRKRWIIFGLYIFSLGILIGYSTSIYYFTNQGILACIISICIVSSDIIIILTAGLEGIELVKTPNMSSTIAFLIRIVMFSSLADYWFIGYSVLYLLLMMQILRLIIDKHYPIFDRVPSLQQIKTNILKTPEFIGFFWMLSFGCVIFYLYYQKQINIPSTTFPIGQNNYPFWQLGIGVILISLGLSFYLFSVRIVQRKMNRIKDYNKYYLCIPAFNQYYIFQIVAYCLIVVTGFYFYSIIHDNFIWLCTVFCPLIYEPMVVFYRNWKANEFNILGDVQKFNLFHQKLNEANQKIDNKKKKMISQLKQSRLNEAMSKTLYSKKKSHFSKSIQKKEESKRFPQVQQQLSNLNLAEQIKSQQSAKSQKPQSDNHNTSEHQFLFIQQVQHRVRFQNWRKNHGFFGALCLGKLLPTDKLILGSLSFLIIFLICFPIVQYFAFNGTMAITISVEVIIMMMTMLPMKKFFETLNIPIWYQFLIMIGGISLNYLYGAFSLTENWRSQIVWIIWWGFINILIICFYAVQGLLRDYGYGVSSIIASILLVLLGGGMGIFVLIKVSTIGGIVVIGSFFYIGYLLALYLLYLKFNKSLPIYLIYITLGVFFFTSISVMITSYILDSFDDFFGFCMTYLIINLIVLGYGLYSLFQNVWTEDQKPNFYSPFGLPVYKFDSNIQSAVKNNSPTIITSIGMLMLLFLSILIQIFLYPIQIGVCFTVVFQILLSLGINYFNNYNAFKTGKVADKISWRVIEQSWKQVKETMLKLKQIEQNQAQLYFNFITKIVTLQNQYEEEKDYEKKSQILMNLNDLQQKKENQQDQMKIVSINLWMTILKKVEGERKRQIIKLVNFINSKNNGLIDDGIVILADGILNNQGKYYQIMKDFKQLDPAQQIKFERHFEIWCEQEELKAKAIQEQTRFQQQQKAKRQEELLERLRNLEPEDPNVPIQEMRDSLTKYRKIMQMQKTNPDLYIDNQFAPSNDLISTDKNIQLQVSQWKRPDVSSFLIDDSNTLNEVKQGNLGDCFLISAIGILGLQNLRKVLGIGEWVNPRGAYMVKFQKININIHSIVDDYLPVDADKNWFLGHCQNQEQLYVNIIEKAYAKLYGSYLNIIGGKVHITLSELTGGFPSELNLQLYREKDLNELYDKIFKYFDNGYLLGAGSPENPLGDRAISEEGIIQGHAYQILNVRNIDGYKLIKLRNPHGRNSAVWTGDWSNSSVRWNARLKGLLNEQFQNDGTFWIIIDDFVFEFKSLYVCMLFEDKQWTRKDFKGQWKGEKSGGLPSKQNPSAKMQRNPQYGVTIYSKSTLFLQLQQSQLLKSSKGKNYIFYMVQKNGGRRITKPDVQILCGKAESAQNVASLSGQIQLQAGSYPYTFSILVACINPGDQGTFTLRLYCNDDKVEFIDDSMFDC